MSLEDSFNENIREMGRLGDEVAELLEGGMNMRSEQVAARVARMKQNLSNCQFALGVLLMTSGLEGLSGGRT
jgi:hypothetical protein